MEEVCRGDPENYSYLNTLAIAYLRAGRHADCIETVERALALRRRAGKGTHPADLLIMALAMLGSSVETQNDAHRLIKDAIQSADEAGLRGDYEVETLIREAETLATRH